MDGPHTLGRVEPVAPYDPGGLHSIEPLAGVGVCSTRPSANPDTQEAGTDTLRLLFATRHPGGQTFAVGEADGWRFGSISGLGITWAEGHPVPGELCNGQELLEAAQRIRAMLDQRLGVEKDLGVSRADFTATHAFRRPEDARAFLTGMSATELPRCEVTRRGHPVHSVSWSHVLGSAKVARVYDKGLERGGEPWRLGRMEDQRRYPSARRLPVEAVSEPGYARSMFQRRFQPIARQVHGVKAASFPVIAQALADEVRYGYRPWKEAERLAGSLVLLTGGAAEGYSRRTMYRRRADLREAGFVVVDDLAEAVEVNLGDVLDAALESDGWDG